MLDEAMLEDLSHIEDIEVVLLGEDECVPHQELQAVLVIAKGEVVIGVGSIELIVVWVVQDRRVQCIEGDEVADMTRAWILDNPRVDDLLTRNEEVSYFILREANVNRIILLEVLVDGIGDLGHVSLGHLAEAFCEGLRGQLVHLVEL